MTIRSLLVCVLPLALLACGTDKGETPSGPTNNPPVADAGPDQVVNADDDINLDASASYDPDGNPIVYHWSFNRVPSDSTLMTSGVFVNNHSDNPETSLRPDVAGTYIIDLQVEDDKGAVSATDMIVITVEPGTSPVANAGPDLDGVVGSAISFDGSSSYDPLGRTLTYTWTLSGAPSHSTASALTGADQAIASLTPDVGGRYVVSLVVNNGMVDSKPDVAYVDVMSKNPEPPVADAGPDINDALDCTSVALNGTDSYDPNSDPLTYEWTLQSVPDGSSATNASFVDRTQASTVFYPDIAGEYTVSLSVNDGTTWSTPDLTVVRAGERNYNSAPLVEAGADLAVDGGTATCEEDGYAFECDNCGAVVITLGTDAMASDPDSDPIGLSWTLVGEGDVDIREPNSLQTEVYIDSAAPTEPLSCTDTEYVFELKAVDCPGATAKDRVKVVVTCCGIEAPDTGK